MAVTIQNKITDQVIGPLTYYYLYEPLPVRLQETDLSAKQIFIDIEIKNVDTLVIEETLVKYGVYDINMGQPINIDLMEVLNQLHDADVWQIGDVQNIIDLPQAIVNKHAYKLKFYSDISVVTPNVSIIPIIGGRKFVDFQPLVSNSFPLTEFEEQGIDITLRWSTYITIANSLTPPNSNLPKVNIGPLFNAIGEDPCAGMIYWKSKLGGWMQWGFDIKTEKKNSKTKGGFEVGMLDTLRNQVNQNPFVPTNYSSVEYSYTLTLKSLSLTQDELVAVSGLSESPVCYYLREPDGRLELRKISSVSAPLNSLANGGDFSVTLKNISNVDFKTR